jgi:hypothetical protein
MRSLLHNGLLFPILALSRAGAIGRCRGIQQHISFDSATVIRRTSVLSKYAQLVEDCSSMEHPWRSDILRVD